MSARVLLALGSVLAGTMLLDASRAEPASLVPTVDTLVERVANAWDSLHVKLTARMTIVRRDREDTEVGLLIRRAGRGRTRIDFLSPPKDEGKVMLQDGDETWLYLPRTRKFVEVPARRNPLAGGGIKICPGGNWGTPMACRMSANTIKIRVKEVVKMRIDGTSVSTVMITKICIVVLTPALSSATGSILLKSGSRSVALSISAGTERSCAEPGAGLIRMVIPTTAAVSRIFEPPCSAKAALLRVLTLLASTRPARPSLSS